MRARVFRALSLSAFTVAAAMLLGCANGAARKTGAETSGSVIDDPESFARGCFERNLGSGGTLTRKTLDLDGDGDGDEDLLIATSAGAGNAGSPHCAFRKTVAGYEFLGDIFLHPLAFRVLPPGRKGEVRMVSYWRLNSSEGTVFWWVSRNGRFDVEWQEKIEPGDGGTEEGRRRYTELFGEGPAPPHEE